jgi:hypothetical protein
MSVGKVLDVQELNEAIDPKDVGTLEVTGDGDELTVKCTAKSGPMLGGLYWLWSSLRGKRGVKISMMVKARYGKPVSTELKTAEQGGLIISRRPTKLMFSGISKEDLQTATAKAVARIQKEMKANAKYKADAPKRKAEASKFQAEKRKEDMAKYDKLYGKGTWKRVTYRQEGGDDGYAYVIRVDGRAKWNGLTQREAMYRKEEEVDAIAKREKLGKYAEKVNEAVERQIKTVKLGQTFKNDKLHTITIQFLHGDTVGYDFLKDGRNIGREDYDLGELITYLNKNGFTLSHTDPYFKK